ncbi:MAG: phosphotransferase [Akkermansiaceae bacterium]|nr:phosphotransferase [Akkermansiaceae bacterium]
MQALNLITEKLVKLHASGWVHRDLKPGNMLRLPSQHSWTLMDFGCAAEQGPPPF